MLRRTASSVGLVEPRTRRARPLTRPGNRRRLFLEQLEDRRMLAVLTVCDTGADYTTIQAAVNDADPGDTIEICSGTFTEQVFIDKDLTVKGTLDNGNRQTTIAAPSIGESYASHTMDGIARQPIVTVQNAEVTIQDLIVDGRGQWNSTNNPDFIGIAYHNAGGEIDNVEVTRVRAGDENGSLQDHPGVFGVYAFSDHGTSRELTLSNSEINDFQRNAGLFNGSDLTVHILDNEIEGAGPTDVIAQNGIQVGQGAQGTISGNTLSGMNYSLPPFVASMILLDGAGETTVSGNTLLGDGGFGEAGIFVLWTDGATVSQNELHGVGLGVIVDRSAGAQVVGNDVTCADVGISVFENPANDSTIVQDNQLTGNGTAIEVGYEGVATILGNLITDNAVGIDIYFDSSAVVEQNFITGNDLGIWIGTGPGDNSTATVFNNDLSDNDVAIEADADSSVDASGNWWGTVDELAISNYVSDGHIDFTPYLASGDADNDPSNGFQGDFSLLYVTALGGQTGASRIQEGIDLVTSGGTVIILAGTYPGDVLATSKAASLLLGDGTAQVVVDGNMTLDANGLDVEFEIEGLDATSEYDNFIVTGTVMLGAATASLELDPNFAPSAGDTFTLIDATAPIIGTFANLPDNSIVTLNGMDFFVDYQGGDGTDLTLTRVVTNTVIVENGTLYIIGGELKDKIEVKGDQPKSGDLEVKLQNKDVKIQQVVSGVDRIVILSYGEDDDITIKDGVYVEKIHVGAGDGNDKVTIEKDVRADEIVVDAGSGDNKVEIKKDIVVAGQILITAGDGKDDVKIEDAQADQIIVDAGDGDNKVQIKKDVVVVGQILITAGDGKDDVKIEDAQADQIIVDAGHGDNKVQIKKGVVATNSIGIVVYGGDGDDEIKLDKDVLARAFLFGGHGDNKIESGNGNSVLVGGDGEDDLKGGDGRNVLIGGAGADKLQGRDGEDILIAGFTSYDQDLTMLDQILAEWEDPNVAYSDRVASLSGLLNPSTVFDDGVADDLKGGKGLDWFFANTDDPDETKRDKTDRSAGEVLTELS